MKKVSLVLTILLGSIYLAIGSSASGQNGQTLYEFASQYASVSNVSMSAVANVQIQPGSDRIGTVKIDYWSSNNQYRLHSTSSPELGVIGDTQASHDGEHYYLWLKQGNVLSIASGDSEFSVAALPNPFMLPLSFLSPTAAMTATSLASATQGLDRLTSLQANKDNGREFFAEASTMEGEPRVFRVVTDTLDQLLVPLELHRQTADGRVTSVIQFSDFEPTGRQKLLFPRSISLRNFDESGAVSMRAEIIITSIEIDQTLVKDQFVVQGDAETKIWDSDRERFVENWPPKE